MKIAQICTNAMSGSVGKIARTLSLSLQNKNQESVLCFSRGKDYTDHSYRFGNSYEIYLHALLTRLFDCDGLHSTRATKDLINYLNEFKPDIIHLHCLHGYYVNYPMLFEFLKDKKVVWTMHDCWAFTGHCANYDYIGCKKWIKECKNCPQKHAYPKSVFLDKSNRNFELKKKIFSSLPISNLQIVTPSIWLKRELEKSFLSKYNISVINNDIDYSIFNTDIQGKIRKTILGVANIWNRQKGLYDFIELSKYIPKDYKILIVGASEKQIKELKKYRIKAITRTADQIELAKLYRTSTILFNPTYEDNYPTVNIEAIACGLPVVTYDTGGSPEIVKKTGMGKIIKKKDYYEVIKYLDDAYNRDSKEKISINPRMVDEYISLYERMLGGNK